MNDPKKALLMAKEINDQIQAAVNKLFILVEATEELRGTNPKEYFERSNDTFSAIIACAGQKMLKDGLNRNKLAYKTGAGTRLAWDLFLDQNPMVKAKVEAEKAAIQAKYAKMSKADAENPEKYAEDAENDVEPEGDEDEDEDNPMGLSNEELEDADEDNID